MGKQFLTALLSILSFGSTLSAAEWPATLENGGLVNINVAKSSVIVNVNYPGLGNRPDCVTALSDGDPIGWQFDLGKLVPLLVLEDGDGVLFPDPNRRINALSRTIDSAAVLGLNYNFVDVGTYVTGLRIRTVDGRTLRQALRSALRPNLRLPSFVGFQRTAVCQ